MTRSDRLDLVRKAWREREETESAADFDRRLAAQLGCAKSTVGRLRGKLGLKTAPRSTRAHVLRERGR